MLLNWLLHDSFVLRFHFTSANFLRHQLFFIAALPPTSQTKFLSTRMCRTRYRLYFRRFAHTPIKIYWNEIFKRVLAASPTAQDAAWLSFLTPTLICLPWSYKDRLRKSILPHGLTCMRLRSRLFEHYCERAVQNLCFFPLVKYTK